MITIETLANNQVVVTVGNEPTFFSYDTPICTKKVDGRIILYSKWNYSKTTSKYRNKFLRETTKETSKKLQEGQYTLGGDYA